MSKRLLRGCTIKLLMLQKALGVDMSSCEIVNNCCRYSREYLAVGNSQGVQIWRLPEILSTEKPNEREGFQDFLHLK